MLLTLMILTAAATPLTLSLLLSNNNSKSHNAQAVTRQCRRTTSGTMLDTAVTSRCLAIGA